MEGPYTTPTRQQAKDIHEVIKPLLKLFDSYPNHAGMDNEAPITVPAQLYIAHIRAAKRIEQWLKGN